MSILTSRSKANDKDHRPHLGPRRCPTPEIQARRGLSVIGFLYHDAETVVGALKDGKSIADFDITYGGFPFNCSLAAAPALPSGAVHLTGVVPWWEYPELGRALPKRITLDAILADGDPFKRLPLSLV